MTREELEAAIAEVLYYACDDGRTHTHYVGEIMKAVDAFNNGKVPSIETTARKIEEVRQACVRHYERGLADGRAMAPRDSEMDR